METHKGQICATSNNGKAEKEKDKVIEYVKNQKEYHKTETFYDEYKRLLIENGIEFDGEYLV